MNEFDEKLSDWELLLNQFLDQELDAAGISELERQAAEDADKAGELAQALQLRDALGAMPRLSAPRALRRKLVAVEDAAGARPGLGAWLWRAAAVACIPLLLIVVNSGGPAAPSDAEIRRGQQDLAIAFGYLNKAGRKTNIELGRTLGEAMLEPIGRNTLRSISLEINLEKEYLL